MKISTYQISQAAFPYFSEQILILHNYTNTFT